MTKKILLGGVLGGLGLFLWGGLAHMVLGLGAAGMQYLPQQQPVMQALQASVPQAGFYIFPQGDKAGNLPAEQVGGAHGILIYHPKGASGLGGGQLLNECFLNIALGLLAAYLLSLAGLRSYTARIKFVVLVGTMTALMTHVEYWNWYGFPITYTVANIFENIVGFLVVGLIAGALVKASPSAQPVAMPAKAA